MDADEALGMVATVKQHLTDALEAASTAAGACERLRMDATGRGFTGPATAMQAAYEVLEGLRDALYGHVETGLADAERYINEAKT